MQHRSDLDKKRADSAMPGHPRPSPGQVANGEPAAAAAAAVVPPRPTPNGVVTDGRHGPGSAPLRAGLSPPPGMRPRDLPTGELIEQITHDVSQLVIKQIDLAKTELRDNLRDEARMLGGLSLAGIGALVTLNLLFVTVVLALARLIPAWAGGLLVSGVVALATVLIGRMAWLERVRAPLERTRRTLKQEVVAVKERLK